MPAGTLGMVVLTCPNAGGTTKNLSGFTDSQGNSWTMRVDTIYNPGTAGQGIEIAAFTAPLVTQLLTSDTMTVTFTTAVVAKAALINTIAGNNGAPLYIASGSVSDLLTSGQTGTAISMTTGSITSGDIVFCWNGAATGSGNTFTIDADTTNGTWGSGNNSISAGTFRCDRQSKLTTGTGTQSWDVSFSSSTKWQCGWVQIREASAGTGTATSNGFFLMGH